MNSEDVRTFDELQLNERRLEALLQLSHMSEASLREIADFALEEGVALTRSKIGYIAFMNEDETVLTMYTWSKGALKICRVPDMPMVYPTETTGLWGEAVRQRRAIITNDYRAPNPWKKGLPEGHVPLYRHMNVPVVDGDRIVVVAGVGNKDDDYDDSDVRQLTLMMEGMWRILQRQTMEAELRRHREQLEQLVAERTEELVDANTRLSAEVEQRRRAEEALRRLLESVDRQRQLVSYEIHDGLAQQIAAARMNFSAYEHLKTNQPEEAAKTYSDGQRLLAEALIETRRLIGGLRPPILDDEGVVTAIARFAADARNRAGLEIEFHSDVQFGRLEPTLENALLRIVQEGVNNAQKHSTSDRARIALTQIGQTIRLEIRDWGIGFAPGTTTTGFGLEGIRERAKLHGGDASVESAPGRGTRIVVNLPVVEPKNAPDN